MKNTSPTGTSSEMDDSSSHSLSTTRTKKEMASDQAMTEADQNLNARMRAALNADPSLRDAGQTISMQSDNGLVTLSGTVATEEEKSNLQSRLQRVVGVHQIENNLQIAPRTSSSYPSDTTASR